MELTKSEISVNWFSSINVSLVESRNSGDQVLENPLVQKYLLKYVCTFNKGDLLWLEVFSSIDEIVKDDFYFRGVQVKFFDKRPPDLQFC